MAIPLEEHIFSLKTSTFEGQPKAPVSYQGDIGIQIDVHFKDCGAQTDASWSDLAMEKLKHEKKKKKKAAAKAGESFLFFFLNM